MPSTPPRGTEEDPERKLVECWKRAHREREESTQDLRRRYLKKVGGFFHRKGFPPGEVEELTQTTFSNVFNGLGDFRGESFAAWLFRIAENVAKDDVRRRHTGKRPGHMQESSLDAMMTDGHEPAVPVASLDGEEEVVQKERQKALRREIKNLSPRRRCCLLLHLYHGFTVKEVALAMNISPETVKALLYQARKQLQERLSFMTEEDPCGDETDDR